MAARFVCVNDHVPPPSVDLLRAACDERELDYEEIEAADFDYDSARRLGLGDLMYRPAATSAAIRVEQFLFAPNVATFYAGDDRPFFAETSQPLLFERAGLPVPPNLYCTGSDRARLKAWVERLGGYPILAKMGGQAGVGVIMLDSYASLCSFVDYALALRRTPQLCAYIRDAMHWRVVVVGARPVAAYTCYAEAGDFRAVIPDRDGIFTTEPPPAIGALAVAAVRATRLEFGGVDILEREGSLYLLESNFPCYYPHAQQIAGIDVAGAMVDHLLRKAAAFTQTIDPAAV
jgi:hypothetical protein